MRASAIAYNFEALELLPLSPPSSIFRFSPVPLVRGAKLYSVYSGSLGPDEASSSFLLPHPARPLNDVALVCGAISWIWPAVEVS